MPDWSTPLFVHPAYDGSRELAGLQDEAASVSRAATARAEVGPRRRVSETEGLLAYIVPFHHLRRFLRVSIGLLN